MHDAVHAGDAGRGFAVVADEIRKLAEESGGQSKAISSVLKNIKESIDKIAVSTRNVMDKFEAIDSHIVIVAEQEAIIRSSMEENEMAAGAGHINTAAAKVNELTAKNRENIIRLNAEVSRFRTD